jgi:hypothetical protein
MGYSITIGEHRKYREDGRWVHDAEDRENPDAPSFRGDEITGRTNHRAPSYSGWHAFTSDTNLQQLFWHEKQGLMREHPGHVVLRKKHLATLKVALGVYREEHPQAQENFFDMVNANLCRLIWLVYWVEWALANCKRPVIVNS